MLYHIGRLIEECDIKYITRGPEAQGWYIFYINRDKVEVDMNVYTTRIRENFGAKMSQGVKKSSEVMISKNISHEGRQAQVWYIFGYHHRGWFFNTKGHLCIKMFECSSCIYFDMTSPRSILQCDIRYIQQGFMYHAFLIKFQCI